MSRNCNSIEWKTPHHHFTERVHGGWGTGVHVHKQVGYNILHFSVKKCTKNVLKCAKMPIIFLEILKGKKYVSKQMHKLQKMLLISILLPLYWIILDAYERKV